MEHMEHTEHTVHRSLGFDRPRGARGILPLIIGGLAAARGIYGLIDANQKKQRNKGYIDAAYRSAQQRQRVKEGDVRQSSAESLASRGLLTTGAVRPTTAAPPPMPTVPGTSTGSKIARAMLSKQHQDAATQLAERGALVPSRTLGDRVQNENSREFALERSDLTAARDQAQRENKADALDRQINSVLNGAGGIAQAYGLSQLQSGAGFTQSPTSGDQAVAQIEQRGVPGVQSAPGRGGIYGAMGVDDPANWFGGVHGLRPFEATGSSWNRKETLTAPGAPNYNFHL